MQLPSLYSKTSKGKLNIWTIRTVGAVICTEWGESGGALQTNSVKVTGKNIGRSNETTPEKQASLEAKAKWESKKLKKYYESPEEAMNTLNIKPMRAYILDENREKKIPWSGGVTIQPKFNGVRCMAYNRPDGSVRLMSRGGKDYICPTIAQELGGIIPKDYCVDGELYIHGTSLQTIRHLIADESPEMQFHVYDFTKLPVDDTEWKERLWNLRTWVHSNPREHIKLSSEASVSNMDAVKMCHDKLVAQGYEGVMLRTPTGKYKLAGKSTDLLKYKLMVDEEFRVVGVGQGRDEVPVYVCIQEEGLTFDVRPKGTKDERKRLLAEGDLRIGQLLTVQYQERSDENKPLFPVGISFRPESDLD